MLDPQTVAREYLAEPLPHRWHHTTTVAAKVIQYGEQLQLTPKDQQILTAAAWLHNIGYAPSAPKPYGFVPLDSASLAASLGFDDAAGLIAWHCLSAEEAFLSGMDGMLPRFPQPTGVLPDLLTYADLTTSADGHEVTPRERFTEILDRYAPTHATHRGLLQAWPRVAALVHRTEQAID